MITHIQRLHFIISSQTLTYIASTPASFKMIYSPFMHELMQYHQSVGVRFDITGVMSVLTHPVLSIKSETPASKCS